MTAATFDRCIFCREAKHTGSVFTDEHSVPLALGGKMKLRKATCENCRGKTGGIEAKVLRGAFHAFRIKAALPSRTRNPPKTLPLFAINDDESSRLDIPLEDYPAMLPLPFFGGPALIQEGKVDFSPRQPWLVSEVDLVEKLFEKYSIDSFATASIDAVSFGLMIYKIAHCLAIHQFGLSFAPYVDDALFSKEMFNFLKYVGSLPPQEGWKPEREIKHTYRFFRAETQGFKLLVNRLTLFANLGAPTYQVVVGEMDREFTSSPALICEDIVVPENFRAEKYRSVVARPGRPGFSPLKPDVTMSRRPPN